MSVELEAALPVVLAALLELEPGALAELALGAPEALDESLGAGEMVALPDTLPDAAVLPGVELALLALPGVDVSVVDEDDALEVGGGVVGTTVVVELLLVLVPLPFPVFGRSQPVTAAVAKARTATTGMIFFMNFSNQDSVVGST